MWYLLDELRKSWLAPVVVLRGRAIPTHTLVCHGSLSHAVTSLCRGRWCTLSCCSCHKTTQWCCNSRALHSAQAIWELRSWWKSYTRQIILMYLFANVCYIFVVLESTFLSLRGKETLLIYVAILVPNSTICCHTSAQGERKKKETFICPLLLFIRIHLRVIHPGQSKFIDLWTQI